MTDSERADGIEKESTEKESTEKESTVKASTVKASTDDLGPVRHSLALHLEGLRTWGIDRIFGTPTLPPDAVAAPGLSAPGLAAPGLAAPEPVPNAIAVAEPTTSPRAASPDLDPAATLAGIAAEVAQCTACALWETRNHTVPGVGDPRAELMFVGEAPGKDEDASGEPFVGPAGKLLDKIIGALGFRREEVFIANTLKCRPPNNRDPLPAESSACTPFLERQVAAIAPRMIVALGRPAAQYLTGQQKPIGRLRGGKYEYHGVPVVVTYHPAYLLRTESAKAECWRDLQVVVREFGRKPLGS